MSLKAILWDNDGVLVDTEHLYFEACARALAEVGFELTREAYIEASLTQGTSVSDLAGLSAGEHERFRTVRNALYAELLEQGGLIIPGAEDTLEALRDRVRMMIVTSSRRDHFRIIHETTGLLRYFESVVDNEDYERSKPNPDPYLEGLARLNLGAEDCIAVEDSVRGMTAANRAGLRCVVVPNALTRDAGFSGAYRVLKDVRDVLGVVEELL